MDFVAFDDDDTAALDDDNDGESPDLGSCCVCEKVGPTVRNILTLALLAPVPGKGWGCLQCGLPADGATAVVCDACLGPLDARGVPNIDIAQRLRFACKGYPTEGRVPIGELHGTFEHRPEYHEGE